MAETPGRQAPAFRRQERDGRGAIVERAQFLRRRQQADRAGVRGM